MVIQKGELLMHKYTYTQPLSLETTPITFVYNEEGIAVYKFQRHYSNGIKRFVDKAMDFRYFLRYDIYNLEDQPIFTCKKVSKKGRVYYEAFDYLQQEKYIVAYDKWKELVPDLMITNGNFQIDILKEIEDWSRFIYNDKEIARWKADVEGEFFIQLEIEEDSPIQDAGFFIGICQCVLFIGG
ncbi:tubby C-terminal domain-like protein [Psychrobacillus soli]|uniref:Tubby C-terminal domain-containing protein n=1 Tax=Psychrobacillus soli TaxID=1543965 RepID=A0A544TFS3_9BACI|nr:hypothetical protein [Psychrobacillus soli]TQR16313.1 hypothetical protein FG383_07445 [Psychrobacillus soli]